MIAKIYPVRRLPAHMGPFDYTCTEHCAPGDLVEISFKGFEMPGIIWTLQEKSEIAHLSQVKRIIEKGVLHKKDIERIDTLALVIAQSPSSILQILPFLRVGD